MSAIKRTASTDEFIKTQYEAGRFGEMNDCAVSAVAIACNVPYEQALIALKEEGRKPRHGASIVMIGKAIQRLGKTPERTPLYQNFILKYPGIHSGLKNVTTHHPARFPKVWKDGCRYVAWTKSHALAIVDGTTHDWSANRAMRITGMFKIVG